MKYFSFKLVVGLLLSGCTVNTLHIRNLSIEVSPSANTAVIQQVVSQEVALPNVTEKPQAAQVHRVVSPLLSCKLYIPLPVPIPIRINFKELEAATTSREINAIALRNVRDLHMQMNNYAEATRKHYADYKKHCVVR